MLKSLKINDVLDLIREKADKLDNVKIYYALRQYKLKNIRTQTVNYVKICLAIDSLGLTITCRLVNALSSSKAWTALHILGDKHVLILKRRLGKQHLEWLMHPAFKRMIEDAQK